MKDKHLVLLDLDGTALYDWKTISQETINSVKKVITLGHIVVIATGRPFRSSKVFYDTLGLKTPIINYNGALIHNPHDQTFKEITNYISLDSILKVFDDIDNLIENAFCEYYEDIYLYKKAENIMPLIHPEGGKIIEGEFKNTLKTNPNGCILLASKGNTQLVEEYLDNNFKGILNHRNWGNEYEQVIEVYSPNTCKGIAMNHISEYFNIRNEKIIAFGDGYNDVEMIKNAGIGVAMENAVEIVKEVASKQTLSNQNHGVAHFLNKFFNLDD